MELSHAISWEKRFVLLGLISIHYCQAVCMCVCAHIIFPTNSGITKSMWNDSCCLANSSKTAVNGGGRGGLWWWWGYFQYLTVIPRQRRSSLQIWGSIFSFRSPALRPDRSPRCPRDRQCACSPLILSVCYPHRLKLSWSPACACVYACAHE